MALYNISTVIYERLLCLCLQKCIGLSSCYFFYKTSSWQPQYLNQPNLETLEFTVLTGAPPKLQMFTD